ncbi:GNAT family N-acetyltransferase [Halobacterium wangiae]|uniref:GNAT family N-acetyltransferase n=1 Tax=Halobacterium wangiae TaxID=2902623 RepID=UPI001E440A0A|nr:GNAT family N-acetyltransferase [Halobacterium wangiae]
MSIDIRPLDDDERWNELIEKAPDSTPFHRAEALDTLEKHGDATLYPLAGFKGQEPVGLFPVFTVSKGPMTAAYSPPPGLKVYNLGPVQLNVGKLKRRKRDRRHRRFIEGVIEWVEREESPRYWNFRTTFDYEDSRPFDWNGYEVEPRYTYLVDLDTSPDELLGRFSSDLRRNLSKEYDVDYEIAEEGPQAIDDIVELTRERHREQNEDFPVTAAYVRELADRLPEGTIRPYVCRIDGEIAGGLIDLESEHTAGAWIANGKTDAPIPVNDLLEWQVCLDAMDRGRTAFDLMGANHERIYSYKAKFAPTLVQYFSVKKWPPGLKTATGLYQAIR